MHSFEPFSQFIQRDNPLVSVVVPCFNKASYLAETIQSIAIQNYQPIEVLIVDDGSTDDSLKVAHSMKDQHPGLNLVIFSKPNTGISDTRNYAIERASGRVILNLDGDDLLKPNLISESIRAMRTTGVNLVTSPVEMFGGKNEVWSPVRYDPFFHRYDNLITTLIVFDKKIWEQVGGYSKAFAFNEDWSFSLAAQKFGLKVAQFSEPLFRYRVTEDGLANQYIKDSGGLSRAMVATANHELYPVSELLVAHDLLKIIPAKWLKRFEQQDIQHPHEWLLKFWLGLAALKTKEFQPAAEFFTRSIELSNAKEWQPLFQYAELFASEGRKKEAKMMYHETRIVCPNLRPLIEERFQSFNL
jgi:glycosyltransferase involved in cell wall biosynthesis